MATYTEIKNTHPELFECFFAFSNEQIAKGIAEHKLEGKEIFSGGNGLYGTKEGIKKLWSDYDNISERISKECEPQAVYNYEFHNHECNYTNDDSEVMKIIIGYFGIEKAKEVKRKFGYSSIESLITP
jgi:hypothetical protein